MVQHLADISVFFSSCFEGANMSFEIVTHDRLCNLSHRREMIRLAVFCYILLLSDLWASLRIGCSRALAIGS
jgi:hypothetical protein